MIYCEAMTGVRGGLDGIDPLQQRVRITSSRYVNMLVLDFLVLLDLSNNRKVTIKFNLRYNIVILVRSYLWMK